jgi:hypothetical protein
MTEVAQRVDNAGCLDDSKICYWCDEDQEWWVYLPGCGAGILRDHEVIEDEDGAISVTPSIRMRGHNNGTPTERHGYLTAGIWMDCAQ